MLSECVAYFAKARRDVVACIDVSSGACLTYGVLAHRAARLAAMLQRLCAPRSARGLRVAVLARNSSEFMCLHIACRGLGAIFVPLNWRLTPAELVPLVELSDPHVVLFETEFAAPAAALSLAVPNAVFLGIGAQDEMERELARHPESAAILRPAAPDDVITLLFTSGTTGKPKAVMVTERNATASSRNFALSVDVSGSTVFLSHMPMFHVAGLLTVACTVLQAGGTLLSSPQFTVDETIDVVANPTLGVTHCFCVPQMTDRVRATTRFDAAPFRRLRVLQTGGAPHPRASVRAWTGDGVRCADGYGMSEAGTVLGMPPCDLDLLARKAGSAGIPALAMEVRLVDSNESDVADGEVGELWLRGPSVTPGYWRDTQATQAAFRDGWLRTGDAALRDEDGFFTLVDRFKDMYISGGENVYPAEIEAALCEFAGVSEAAVVGVPDTRWGETGVAFIVLAPGSPLADEEILAFCRQRLAGYKLPKRLCRVTELPRTASGKIRKDVLRATWRAGN